MGCAAIGFCFAKIAQAKARASDFEIHSVRHRKKCLLFANSRVASFRRKASAWCTNSFMRNAANHIESCQSSIQKGEDLC
jgi:hypothetical protein